MNQFEGVLLRWRHGRTGERERGRVSERARALMEWRNRANENRGPPSCPQMEPEGKRGGRGEVVRNACTVLFN